jgi:hypothetical protein
LDGGFEVVKKMQKIGGIMGIMENISGICVSEMPPIGKMMDCGDATQKLGTPLLDNHMNHSLL